MNKLYKFQVLTKLAEAKFLPIFSHEDPQIACEVGLACARGGAGVFELTNRSSTTPQAFSLLKQELDKSKSAMVLGIGSIVEPASAAAYINLGAAFVVAPNFNPEVAKVCNRRGVAYIPGCFTPTEVNQAQEAGCEVIKYFPADSKIGPQFIKSLRGPCPWTAVVATGGIEPTKEGMDPWFKAGCIALGLGSQFIKAEYIEKKDYKALETKVKEVVSFL